jgi:hypothetical protein
MQSYTEAARKLDRDYGTVTGILLSLLSPSILSRVTSERNRIINNSLEAEFIRLTDLTDKDVCGINGESRRTTESVKTSES